MKQKVMMPTEIEATEILMDLAVRYDEEDIPNDFPGRNGNTLTMRVEIDTGKIIEPADLVEAEVYMKVCDQGNYEIYAPDGKRLGFLKGEYVPHGLVPGEYGDYVDFKIKGGIITNWPKKPSLKDFFPED